MTSAISPDQVGSLYGRDVYDRNGDKIGALGQVYSDESGQPVWASVKTGLFGMNESLVPLHEAQLTGDRLQVPYEKAQVKDAPNVDVEPDEPLDEKQVQQLYQHYNIGWDQAGTEGYATGYTSGAEHTRQAYTGPSSGDDAMTRSEERLNVGKERQETGRARLRKYVVTENVQQTVPVQREEVRLEREPITEENRDAAYSGADITESEHEVTLHEERPVVDKETVPVERVRLGKETVGDEQTVGGEVRKEQIEADVPGEEGRQRLD